MIHIAIILPGFLLIILLTGLYFSFRRGAVAGYSGGANRRRYPRLPLQVSAELVTEAGHKLAGRTRDLSIMGMFLIGGAEVPVNSECKVCLLVERDGAPIRLNLKGKVVRKEETGLGIQFTAMNQECYENLRYLIHYNVSIHPSSSLKDCPKKGTLSGALD